MISSATGTGLAEIQKIIEAELKNIGEDARENVVSKELELGDQDLFEE
ncbi:MAG: hypothetical protein R3A80_09395 [Bdellovibrionota bacterium]